LPREGSNAVWRNINLMLIEDISDETMSANDAAEAPASLYGTQATSSNRLPGLGSSGRHLDVFDDRKWIWLHPGRI